jgi:hypothetical protein
MYARKWPLPVYFVLSRLWSNQRGMERDLEIKKGKRGDKGPAMTEKGGQIRDGGGDGEMGRRERREEIKW